MQDILDTIKKNSGVPEKIINEESTSNDIATTIDMVSELIDEKYNDSIGYLISEVQPLEGSWGIAYASKRKSQSEDFEIVKRDIYTKTFKVKTGYSREVWQDVIAMFGKGSKRQAGKVLAGLSAYTENSDVIDFVGLNAETKQPLLINISNSAWITSQISKRVAESVLDMNKYAFKTLDSFCILSPKWASSFLGTASYVKSDGDSMNKDSTLFVGRYGRTDFYVNLFRNDRNAFNDDYNDDYSNEEDPDNGPDYAYVGLKSDISGYSSLIFAPYQYEAQIVVEPSDGSDNLFIYNRYGLIMSPLHEPLEGRSMLHRFIIEEI